MKKNIIVIFIFFHALSASFTHAEITLAKSGHIDSAFEMFRNRTLVERERIVLSFINTRKDRIIYNLIHALTDPEPRVRYAAAWVMTPSQLYSSDEEIQLKAFQTTEIIESLIAALGDADPWVQLRILETLLDIELFKKEKGINLDEQVKEALIPKISDPNPFIRAASTRSLLPWKGDPEVQKALRSSFKDEISLVRHASLWAGNDDPESLKEALRDVSPSIRLRAVADLRTKEAYTADPHVIDLFIERLQDPYKPVVFQSISALSESRDPKAIEPLLALSIKEKNWSNIIRNTLEEITGKPFEEILKEYRTNPPKRNPKKTHIKQIDVALQIKKLEKGNLYERVSAALELSLTKQSEAVGALIRALHDPEPFVRYAAVGSFETYVLDVTSESDQILDNLFEATRDPHIQVRRTVLNQIGSFISNKHYRARIIEFMGTILEREEDPFARLSGASALGSVTTKRSGQLLMRAFDDEFYEIRKRAVDGVRLFCFPEAMEPLLKALRDPVWLVRMFAAANFATSNRLEGKNYTRVHEALSSLAQGDPVTEVRDAAQRAIEQLELKKSSSKQSTKSCFSDLHIPLKDIEVS